MIPFKVWLFLLARMAQPTPLTADDFTYAVADYVDIASECVNDSPECLAYDEPELLP